MNELEMAGETEDGGSDGNGVDDYGENHIA